MLFFACSGDTPSAAPTPPPPTEVHFPVECPAGSSERSDATEGGEAFWCELAGVKTGPYLETSTDGEQRVQGGHVLGERDGLWVSWHTADQEESRGRYRSGQKNGPWTWWHPNGNRSLEGDFLNGRRAGRWTTWFVSGEVESSGMYHNGRKHGPWLVREDSAENAVGATEVWQDGTLVDTKQ